MHRQRDLRRRKGGKKDIMHRLGRHGVLKKTITNPKKKKHYQPTSGEDLKRKKGRKKLNPKP